MFFSLHISRAQRLAPARTRTRVVRLGVQSTDHWTTGQSHGIGMPMVQLTKHVKSSTLYSRMVVWSYIQIFSARWVTTILYDYGATLCELHYYLQKGFLGAHTSTWSCVTIPNHYLRSFYYWAQKTIK